MPRHADPNAKEALIAAARAEFARRGLRGARIEDITAACGLSKGAFYLHFDSKEALFGDLVHGFQARMSVCAAERTDAVQKFGEEHGAVDARDAAENTDRYQELIALDVRLDHATLEAMWDYRDVVGVLVRGCQGTPFEGAVWELVDVEAGRVRNTFEQLQKQGSCRADIPGELFGSLIVGTYLLLGIRMSRMYDKPDLATWAKQLHTLIHEGSEPVDFKNALARAESKPPHQFTARSKP
jgi:AcrR family transcriptional regulator